jgi:hypothetical protein
MQHALGCLHPFPPEFLGPQMELGSIAFWLTELLTERHQRIGAVGSKPAVRVARQEDEFCAACQ